MHGTTTIEQAAFVVPFAEALRFASYKPTSPRRVAGVEELFDASEAASEEAVVRSFGATAKRARPVGRSTAIRYIRPSRGALAAEAVVARPEAEIMDTLEHAGVVEFPVTVLITDESGAPVAETSVDWCLVA